MEKFVTYEQAVALKEIGYNKYSWFGMECSLYKADGKHTFYANGIGDETYISAPLKSQVFEWFRKNYNTNTCISWRDDLLNYDISLTEMKKGGYFYYKENFNNYEEAESACIDKLIEIVQNNLDK